MSQRIVDHTGSEFNYEALEDNFLKDLDGSKHVSAMDMDNTMFDKDLGVLVFLEKLSDPHFWDFEDKTFAYLLLPIAYKKVFDAGVKGEFIGLDPKLCRLALDLWQDICKLYSLKKHLIHKEGSGQFQSSLVKEFARKMLEFDKLFLKMDPILSSHFQGQLLMRTRFFAGKEPKLIKHYTQEAMKLHVGRYLDLELNDSLKNDAGQVIDEARLEEVNGSENFLRVDRLVEPVELILKITKKLLEEKLPTIVVTANLEGIAKTAVEVSDYDLLNQQDLNGSPVVYGSRLRNGKRGELAPQMDGLPVHGVKKAEKALLFADTVGRTLKVAMGDSPHTDGALLKASLRQEGIVFVVGQDFNKTRAKFDRVFRELIEQVEIVRERIFYIVETV